MAKVTIKNITNARSNIVKTFERIKKNPFLLREIGDATVDYIVRTNQAGKSPQSGRSHGSLSQSWIERRKYLEKFNQTDQMYLGSRRSNVTFSGNLMRAIRKYDIKSSDGVVDINPEGEHPGYRTAKKPGKPVEYKKLLTYLADQGRVVLFINEVLVKRINVIVKTFIRKQIIRNRF